MNRSVIANHIAGNTKEVYGSFNFNILNEDVSTIEDNGEMNDYWAVYVYGEVNMSRNEAWRMIIYLKKMPESYFNEVTIQIHQYHGQTWNLHY